MASISSVSSTNQYALQQTRLQEARVAAGKAGETARSLRSQADEAQRVADREQSTADSLAARSDEAQGRAAAARSRLAVLGAAGSIIDTTA